MLSLRSWFSCSLLLPSLILLASCQNSPTTGAGTAVAAQVERDPVPHQREADDLGRFIAGLPGKPGSPFLDLEQSDAWKEHRRLLDEAWGQADSKLIPGLQEFQKAELADAALQQLTVYYPFGGPDVLTAALFFPRNPVYVLVGLEPAGTLPTPSQIDKKDLARYLAVTRETVASVLGRSFFITRQMDRQFRGQVTDGLLVPILHLLVRTHHEILGFRYVRLDDKGDVIDRAANYHAPGKIGNKGVEIEFKGDSEQASHKLFYFSVNLSDQRLKDDKPFLDYADRLKGSVTLLKATSYMTHKPAFSMVRNQILANSAVVLQDDSGIPYHYFEKSTWHVQLYGEYQHPYGSFRYLEQSDLRRAFEAGGAKPLSLRIGYGYSKVASNLLLAKRVDTSVAALKH
jgi:hypothetical protein